MLVLSRKEGERLVIGDNITLVISKVVGNRVTIGIEAPKDVKVMRAELVEPGIEAVESILQGETSGKTIVERKPRVDKIGMKDFTASVRMLRRKVG